MEADKLENKENENYLKEDVPDEVKRHSVASQEKESKFRRRRRGLNLQTDLRREMWTLMSIVVMRDD